MTRPPDTADGLRFVAVDWSRYTGNGGTGAASLSPATGVAALGLVAVAALYAYDVAVVPAGEPLVGTWHAPVVDWLLLVSLALFVGYGLVPVATDDRLRRRLRATVRSRPAVAASVAWLAAVFVLGTVGSVALGAPAKHLAIPYQPPALLSGDPYLPGECVGAVVDGRCRGTLQYPLGTNVYGEDLVALVVSGMRVAVTLSLVTATILVAVATAVGTLAGFLGGRVDAALTGYVNVQRTVPAFLVYVILAFVTKPSLLVLIVVFGFLNWGGIAHVVRTAVKDVRSAGYVRAARSAGAGHLHVVRRHVLPNVSGRVAVATTRQVAVLILVEAAISYLELNDVMVRSWGEIVASGVHGQWFPLNWWVVAAPGAALVLTVISVSVLGDALRDVLDPQDAP